MLESKLREGRLMSFLFAPVILISWIVTIVKSSTNTCLVSKYCEADKDSTMGARVMWKKEKKKPKRKINEEISEVLSGLIKISSKKKKKERLRMWPWKIIVTHTSYCRCIKLPFAWGGPFCESKMLLKWREESLLYSRKDHISWCRSYQWMKEDKK